MGGGWPADRRGHGVGVRQMAWSSTIVLCLCLWTWCEAVETCEMGELRCHDGSCVAADQYCDGENDCADGEDEPPKCTQCNRVYYGTVGKTYELFVHWPTQNKRPPICNLTLVAAGGPNGDLVQLAFHKFSIGKFNSHTENGCPHGHMQVIENQRMYRPGFWCGDGVGIVMYYSETPSVSVIVTRLPVDDDLTALDAVKEFYLKMTYKFLRRESAVVRYGILKAPKYLGLRDQTTVCNALFSNCDQRPCFVQSPNFPGMYPRNTTCYYHLKQSRSPEGKKALISLSQEDGRLVHVKSLAQAHDTAVRSLKLYEDCYYVGDYVRVYDGNSTRSPVLVTFCRGDIVPEIVSSGPDILIEFTTSPFDSPNHEVPWTHVAGFELKAETRFVPKIEIGENCHVQIQSSSNQTGWVEGANHSVPPNTTCTWEFIGNPGQVVWLTFVQYLRQTQLTKHQTKSCSTKLTIIDGKYNDGSIVAEHCHDTEPHTCDRARRLLQESHVRPCDTKESYVSTGQHMAVTQHFGDGSVVTKVSFLLRYEFVDRQQTGDWTGDPCYREIRSGAETEGNITFTAPRDVFLYGRGGRTSITCSWRFLGAADQTIRLTINNIKTGSSSCRTQSNHQTKAWQCLPSGNSHMEVSVSEWPWSGVELPLACVCSTDVIPFTRKSHGPDLTLNFTIKGMLPYEDYRDYSFNVTFEFVKAQLCKGSTRILTGAAGEIVATSPSPPNLLSCEGFPWLLKTPPNHALYLTLPGASLDNGTCQTDTRLFFHVPGKAEPVLGVCPAPDKTSAIKFFWPPPNTNTGTIHAPQEDRANISGGEEGDNDGDDPESEKLDFQDNEGESSLVLVWKPRSSSDLRLRWLTTWKPIELDDFFSPTAGGIGGWREEIHDVPCKELCPELGACIPSELWCDGRQHCPEGSDEMVANCLLERVPWLYLVIAIVTLVTLLLITISAIRRHRMQLAKKRQQDARRVSTQESILPPKEKSLSAYALDYTDMDFETTV
ncbi:uncharacterized protein LOC135225787 isoform X1 [Macrobrachium nipponense]|uniref:uncharacterized protein LOC135225787 isoform X1 n=2 Tax=Macrobrachium nipponense TaxID=159736 RepID=UPI0030C805BE